MQASFKKKSSEWVLSVMLFMLLLLAVKNIALVSAAIRKALTLCASALIPTLFPFLILTDLLFSVETTEKILSFISRPFSRLLRLSPIGGNVFLLGSLFGFPMGAKAVAHYYSIGMLSQEEGERLLLFSGNASPFFLIGSVGEGMLLSFKKGVTLYFIQLVISLGCGMILGVFATTDRKENWISSQSSKLSFSKTVQGAVKQSLFISGYVLFFSALLAVTLPYIKNPFLSRLLACLFEISNACAIVSENDFLTLPFCAFATCFSGLSVYFQTLDCIDKTRLNTRRYLPVKLLCGAVGFFLALLFHSR